MVPSFQALHYIISGCIRAKMSALASLNAARRSFTQKDAVTQEVEDDVFQDDFVLPVGLDHTK
jgi:hypothetical protein